jgi:hypothetical protein
MVPVPGDVCLTKKKWKLSKWVNNSSTKYYDFQDANIVKLNKDAKNEKGYSGKIGIFMLKMCLLLFIRKLPNTKRSLQSSGENI